MKRRLAQAALVALLAWGTLTGLASATPAGTANLDTTADRVFGQPDFISNIDNNGGLNANSLDLPRGVALDAQRNLYVVDSNNSRVLEYD